jgi:hypothetical protein
MYQNDMSTREIGKFIERILGNANRFDLSSKEFGDICRLAIELSFQVLQVARMNSTLFRND